MCNALTMLNSAAATQTAAHGPMQAHAAWGATHAARALPPVHGWPVRCSLETLTSEKTATKRKNLYTPLPQPPHLGPHSPQLRKAHAHALHHLRARGSQAHQSVAASTQGISPIHAGQGV